jgi:hypothetical protein
MFLNKSLPSLALLFIFLAWLFRLGEVGVNVGMFGVLAVAVWAPQQAPAHAGQPVVQVGFGAEMMVMRRRIPSEALFRWSKRAKNFFCTVSVTSNL